ncbi:MAG: hypothetical protein H0Z28_04425 [Archaeoglobus sp.]|nr:hypothetical protein [Archaeoglobus sp.]
MTWQKEVSELIENVICDLFNLRRINGFYDAEDEKFRKTIEIKAASRFVLVSGKKRAGRFFFYHENHAKLRDKPNPHYLFVVYHIKNGELWLMGIKELDWQRVDEMLNFYNENLANLGIGKVFRVSELKPVLKVI